MLFWTLRCFATVGGEILQNWSAAPVKQQMERSSLKHGGHFEMHKLELWNYLGTFKTSWSPPHPTPHPPNWKQTCLCKGMGVFLGIFFWTDPFDPGKAQMHAISWIPGITECDYMMTNDNLDWILGQEQPQRSKRLGVIERSSGTVGTVLPTASGWQAVTAVNRASLRCDSHTGRFQRGTHSGRKTHRKPMANTWQIHGFRGIVGQDFDNPPCVCPVKSRRV